MLLLASADFFQNELFQKILSGTLSECQTNSLDLDQDQCSVGPDLGYDQTTKVGTSKEIVKCPC